MDIVTGHVGSAHVTSWQDRDLNQGIFGPDTYILNVGSKLAATIISNNEIRIADGTLVMQGCQGVIQKGTYDTISIDNGTQGLKRNDLICAEYVKSGGVESLGWTVIKGTPAASNPSDPSYTSGDIQNGDTPVQVPVYRVIIDGLTIYGVYRQIPIAASFGEVSERAAHYTDSLSIKNGSYSTTEWSLGAGTFILCADIMADPTNAGTEIHAAIIKKSPVGGGQYTYQNLGDTRSYAPQSGYTYINMAAIDNLGANDTVYITVDVANTSTTTHTYLCTLYYYKLR